MRRLKDWMQDLNFNLCTSKVVRTTCYFEDLNNKEKLRLMQALDTEKELR